MVSILLSLASFAVVLQTGAASGPTATVKVLSARQVTIGDVERTGQILDVVNLRVITVPKGDRETVQRRLAGGNRGHVGYEEAKGKRLFAVRGAELAKLGASDWTMVARMDDASLRQYVTKNGSQVVLLSSLRGGNAGPTRTFAGVLTKKGRLAVLRVISFDSGVRIHVLRRTRVEHETTPARDTPAGQPTSWQVQRIYLPKADTLGAPGVLDLASGHTLVPPYTLDDPRLFTRLGKGDLC